jgi:carotenoid cleavage dioxygenase
MAPSSTPSPQPSNLDAVGRDLAGLDVRGTLPTALSGQLIGVGPDVATGPPAAGVDLALRAPLVISAVQLHAGRAVSYRSRSARGDASARNIVGFGGALLVLGDGSLAAELDPQLETLRPVDLAGQSRGICTYPKLDPATGDLHLLATADNGTQTSVVVSAGALTRRSRPLVGVPSRATDLAITRDRVLFGGDGFLGVVSREVGARITWIATGFVAPVLVHAHDVGETVVVLALTPSLERWTVHVPSATVGRDVLDPTPRRAAAIADHQRGAEPRFVWTTGDTSADRFDLTNGPRVSRSFGAERAPGNFVFVADPARTGDDDGGWLLGFVHSESMDATDLVVLDAADLTRSAIAAVRIPRRVPRGLHSTWIPSTHP